MDFINFIPIYLAETLGRRRWSCRNGSGSVSGGYVCRIGCQRIRLRSAIETAIDLDLRRLVVAKQPVCGGAVEPCNFPLATSMQLNVAMAIIFVLGFSISPSYYVPMSIFAIDFGGKHSGFLVAAIDIFGYSGALVVQLFRRIDRTAIWLVRVPFGTACHHHPCFYLHDRILDVGCSRQGSHVN